MPRRRNSSGEQVGQLSAETIRQLGELIGTCGEVGESGVVPEGGVVLTDAEIENNGVLTVDDVSHSHQAWLDPVIARYQNVNDEEMYRAQVEAFNQAIGNVACADTTTTHIMHESNGIREMWQDEPAEEELDLSSTENNRMNVNDDLCGSSAPAYRWLNAYVNMSSIRIVYFDRATDKILVYPLNGVRLPVRSFNNLSQMRRYYSDSAVFIDYETSRKIEFGACDIATLGTTILSVRARGRRYYLNGYMMKGTDITLSNVRNIYQTKLNVPAMLRDILQVICTDRNRHAFEYFAGTSRAAREMRALWNSTQYVGNEAPSFIPGQIIAGIASQGDINRENYRTLLSSIDNIRNSIVRIVNTGGRRSGRTMEFSEATYNRPDSGDSYVQNISDTLGINDNLIYGYHGGPRQIRFKHTNDESGNVRYFGIELEIDTNPNGRGYSDRRKHALATKLNEILNEGDYNSLVKFERDGSLHNYGFEIIFQPMTYTYAASILPKIKIALREIQSAGYCSHDAGTCGLHIHVNRDSFESENTIDNVILLFENFKNEIIAFSRRTQEQMQWTSFVTDWYYNNDFDKSDLDSIKDSCDSHGVAINLGNENTVEFRVFRGTTNLQTIYASLQFVDNIIDIANKNQDVSGIEWNDIIKHNEAYGSLQDYNESRGIMSNFKAKNNVKKQEVNDRRVILVKPWARGSDSISTRGGD